MQIYSNMSFKNPVEIIKAFDSKGFKQALNKIEELSKKFYILGYIRYEAKNVFFYDNFSSLLPILYFEVYKDYEDYAENPNAFAKIESRPLISYIDYEEAIETIKNEIASGNTYEVNYTYDWEVTSKNSERDIYDFLLNRQRTPYNTFIKNEYEIIMSYSPELFFEMKDRMILTKPMKGTVKRGATPEEDRLNIEFLQTDIKNRAENVMIVDLLRNDLGKIAKTGTVKVPSLFEIETHKTLHQMTSTITAEVKDGVSLYDVFEAIFPCGSITGAPKISTMQIIDRVEKGKRNIYCGAIGFLSPQKIEFSVPIRILQKTNDAFSFKYRVGGAVVWDSDTLDEWNETFTKMSFLKFEDFKLVETIKAEKNKLIYGQEHFDRLEKSAKILGFRFDKKLRELDVKKDGIVRILLSKDGTYEVEYKSLSGNSSDFIEISDLKVNSENDFLYHKTTFRPWYKKSFEKIQSKLVYDEVFFNEKDELTEGARSNILLQIDGKLYTPSLHCGLLNGILRQKMLKDGLLEEKVLYKKDLLNAEKIFCINSVRGIKEVRLK